MVPNGNAGPTSTPAQAGDRTPGPGAALAAGAPMLSLHRSRRFGGLCQGLGHADALACLELIHRSLACPTRQALSALVGGLGELLEADFCACLLSSRAPSSVAARILIVDGTFPPGWLKVYAERQFHRIDPIVAENFTNFSHQAWADTYSRRTPPKIFTYLAEDFGLRNGLTSGMRQAGGDGGSLFSFSGARLQLTDRNRLIQDLVLPHLHQALSQLSPGELPVATAPDLSSREREVLQWIGAGKSSWETGVILRIAERTVNYHLRNILRKLDAVNRPQAVATALQLGLLELP